MHQILFFSDKEFHERAEHMLEKLGLANEVSLKIVASKQYAAPTPEDLNGCEAFISESALITAEVAENLRQAGIRCCSVMSIGMNHVDVDACTKNGIIVTNCPGYCAEEVALHTVALMLDLMRNISMGYQSVLEGNWNPRVGIPTHRPAGQTLGLVFFGRIAQQVAPLAQALGMNVVVWAPTKSKEELAAAGCKQAETLEELLIQSDVVSLHCPLIPETKNLMGEKEFELMKPHALFINTARGECVDEDALLNALNTSIARNGEKGILACGLDTVCGESNHSFNRKLIEHPRSLVTPHLAYNSEEAVDALVRMTIEAAAQFVVEHRIPDNAYNAEDLIKAGTLPL